MATMGRKKKAVAAGWNAINKQRDDESRKAKEEFEKKEDTPEERAEKERILREAGILK